MTCPKSTPDLPRVLLVDDEQALLDGLRRQLRGQFTVELALGGREGLAVLSTSAPFAVVVSDYHMPLMDGATFLAAVRAGTPDTTRILLTGQADLAGAARVVNEGAAFRLLLKPISHTDLVVALSAAVEQHRLVTAEHDLLDRTLRGSVRALTEVLSLACPQAFARASRMRRLAELILDATGMVMPWEVDLAVMLSQVGAITLPPAVLDKLDRGEHLRPEEAEMVARLPVLADQVLADIPRLELVRAAILAQDQPYCAETHDSARLSTAVPPFGARVLRVVRDYDGYESSGHSSGEAVGFMRATQYRYDPALLTALEVALAAPVEMHPAALQVRQLATRMTLADDIYTKSGIKLVSRGQETTVALIGRIRNFAKMPAGIEEPIMVLLPGPLHRTERAVGRSRGVPTLRAAMDDWHWGVPDGR